jgi:hypothetical protein
MRFAEREPLPDQRGDIQTAMLASILVNVFRGKNSRVRPPVEFVPDYWADRKEAQAVDELSEAEQVAFLEMLNAALGGQDLRKK